jgi:hypothetical protein
MIKVIVYSESRIIAGDPIGYNAIELNAERLKLLSNNFSQIQILLIKVQCPPRWDNNKFNEVEASLKQNPPAQLIYNVK